MAAEQAIPDHRDPLVMKKPATNLLEYVNSLNPLPISGGSEVATAPSDNMALATPRNPVHAVLMGYDGATLDMIRTMDGFSSGGNVGVLAAGIVLASGYRVDAASSVQATEVNGTGAISVSPVRRVASGNYKNWQDSDILKTNDGASIAAGASLTVWTPAAGKKFLLQGLSVVASLAGNYTIYDQTGSVVIMRLNLAAAQQVIVYNANGNGYLSLNANSALLFYNEGVSVSNMRAVAWGSEI